MALGIFKDCRLARMSDGHYRLLRNLGPVKRGNGMKHHEVVIDFSRRGMVELFRQLIKLIEGSRRLPMILADDRDQFQGARLFASTIPFWFWPQVIKIVAVLIAAREWRRRAPGSCR